MSGLSCSTGELSVNCTDSLVVARGLSSCTESSLLHVGLSLVAASGGYSVVVVCGLLTAAASLIVEHGF